jgi:hypothetical protein
VRPQISPMPLLSTQTKRPGNGSTWLPISAVDYSREVRETLRGSSRSYARPELAASRRPFAL